MTPNDYLTELGFLHLSQAFDETALASLANFVAAVPSRAAGQRWVGPELSRLLSSPSIQLLHGIMQEAMLVPIASRAVAFQKDAGANWFVPAHQDRSIPIPSGATPAGFSRPTRKGDGWQAEAPIDVLEAMINARIFIDDAGEGDGPLEVIPGSHRQGRIAQDAIPDLVAKSAWKSLTGAAGDVVLLSPLLLHRSRRAEHPRGRRVLQVEFMPYAVADRWGLNYTTFASLEIRGCQGQALA
jgi:hypothetical protein